MICNLKGLSICVNISSWIHAYIDFSMYRQIQTDPLEISWGLSVSVSWTPCVKILKCFYPHLDDFDHDAIQESIICRDKLIKRFKIWYWNASIYWYRYASINGSKGGSIFVKILSFPVYRKIDVCMTSWQYIDAYR